MDRYSMEKEDGLEYDKLKLIAEEIAAPSFLGIIALNVTFLAELIWSNKLTLFLFGCSGLWVIGISCVILALRNKLKKITSKYKGEEK